MAIANQIKLGISNPSLLIRKMVQKYNYFKHSKKYNTDGVDFINQDWDNLLILDACRYDLFEKENNISGELQCVVSRGSATPEFLRGNFDGKDLTDTVYITTNPMLYRHQNDVKVDFHDTINLWAGESWDNEQETVLPETVTAESKKIAEKYPNKRLIVHYMQPHYPFIESDTTFDKGHIGEDAPDGLTTWMQIATGKVEIDKEEIWNAYADNLRRALPHVEELVHHLRGKTVVTSDHGNMFGERSSPSPSREWGHPEGIWTDELVKVPWLEVPYNERREITHDSSNTSGEDADDQVRQRLESLGYR